MADFTTTLGIDRDELKTGLAKAEVDINQSLRKSALGVGNIGKGIVGGIGTAIGLATKAVLDYGQVNSTVQSQINGLLRETKSLWADIGRDISSGGIGPLQKIVSVTREARSGITDFLADVFRGQAEGGGMGGAAAVLSWMNGDRSKLNSAGVDEAMKKQESLDRRLAYESGTERQMRAERDASRGNGDLAAAIVADRKREERLRALAAAQGEYTAEVYRSKVAEIESQAAWERGAAKRERIERDRLQNEHALQESYKQDLDFWEGVQDAIDHNKQARSRFVSDFRGERLDAAENRLNLVDRDSLDYAGRKKLEQDQRELAVLREEFSLAEKIKALDEDQLLTGDERLTQAAAWRDLTRERINAINSQPLLGPRQFSGVFGGSLGLGHAGIGLDSQVFGGGAVSSPLLATGRQQLKIAEDQLKELRKIADKAGSAGAQFQ